MKDAHLTLDTMAKWLTGDLAWEDTLRLVVPHLLAACPTCQERFLEIQQLKEEFGHWDERVAVFEGKRAPELLAELMRLPFDEQLGRVSDDPEYQSWALCQLLLKQSLAAAFEDPAEAVNWAELAVAVAQELGTAYDPHWVSDLRARAFAHLGNARRTLGELRSAETAFREAAAHLGRSMTGNTLVEAEILDMKGSLRRDQRRFAEALDLMTRAFSLYRESGDAHGIGMGFLKRAKVLEESGDLAGALALLREAVAEIDTAAEPLLHLYARHNLAACLVLVGRPAEAAEAEELLAGLREPFSRLAKPLDLVRLDWTQGRAAFGLGRVAEAEAIFRRVHRDLLERGMGYDAALVALDLAILFAVEQRGDELKKLAVEMVSIFRARDVHREALAALVIFQQACAQEQLTVQLATEIAAILRRERRPG